MRKGITVPQKYAAAVREMVLIAAAVTGCALFDILNIGEGSLSLWRGIANAVPIYIFGKILLLLTNSIRAAALTVGVSCFLASVANYYVFLFRGRPVLPWDLEAMGTAASVMGGYSYEPTWQMGAAFLLLALFCLAVFRVRYKGGTRRSIRSAALSLLVIAGLTVLYALAVYPRLTDSLWDSGPIYEQEGVVAGFLSHCKYATYHKPARYSAKGCRDILDEVVIEEPDEAGVTAQNIIVVMNESFADLRVIGDFMPDGDYMPYVDSIADGENALRGNLHVSVFGGMTANTEFEALTGASGAYIPAVPYQTIVSRRIRSLADVLKEQGFYAEAFHPFYAANWNRDRVYPFLGFDRFLSVEGMDVADEDILRWCVSDYSDYQQIIRSYEENPADRFFLFNVTMQNHGGYADEFEGFESTVDLSDYGDFKEAEVYLTLVQESDRQLKRLIRYFSKVEEPTLICFFGDHQPYLGDEFLELLYGKSLDDLTMEEKRRQYITPIVLWSNYGLKEASLEQISPNYLSALILKEANLSMPAYESFLWQLYQEYPVISGTGILDKGGRHYKSPKEAGSELLTRYGWLQYDRLKNRRQSEG